MTRGPYQGLAVRPGQNKVLKILDTHESMLQQELLKELGIRASSLTELLKKLEEDGFVTRKRSNRGGREIVVSITEKGRVSALERKLASKERDESLFGCLTSAERNQLQTILDKLLMAWRAASGETDGQRRERAWSEYSAMQDEQRDINKLLESL